MMRSMFSGITGLKNFQSAMDVVGNNIANVNTVGFKASRVSFQTAFSQLLKSGNYPSTRKGGTNPMQIGLGSALSSIDKIMTQGSFQNTGKKTDLAIQGDGFFVLSNGSRYFYTRAGNFDLDMNGTLIQPSTGLKVQGWIAEIDPRTGKRFVDTNKPIGDIVISTGMRMEAKKTSLVEYSGNLNSDVGLRSFNMTLKDVNNEDREVRIWFTKKGRISKTSDPFADSQRFIVNLDTDNDGVIDGIGFIKLDKFGNVLDAGIRDSRPLETGTITISGGSGTINFSNTYTGRYMIVLTNTATGEITTREIDLISGNTYDLTIDDGNYNWQIRPIDITENPMETGTITISGGSGTINFSNTYTGKYKLVLKDQTTGNIVYSDLISLSSSNSYTLSGLSSLSGDYDFELLQPISSEYTINSGATLAISETGNLKFYEADDPANFYSPEYSFPKYTTTVKVYDSLGNAYNLYLEFLKLGYVDSNHRNVWIWRAYLPTGESIEYLASDGLTVLNSAIGGAINFDESGRVKDYGLISGSDTSSISWGSGNDAKYVQFNASTNGDGVVKIQLDFSDISQFAGENSVAAISQDGNPLGVLDSFAINEVGEIIGTFSNGLTDVLGKIALAVFNNPAGLKEIGNSLYVESPNSGIAQIGEAGTGGRGTLIPGALEMSNVDLAEEFTKMIIAQRGFQANARVITTSDQILNELVNIKR